MVNQVNMCTGAVYVRVREVNRQLVVIKEKRESKWIKTISVEVFYAQFIWINLQDSPLGGRVVQAAFMW